MLPDNSNVFTVLCEKLKFNTKTVPVSECILSNNFGTFRYHKKNVNPVRNTKLGPIYLNFVLPCPKYTMYNKLYYNQYFMINSVLVLNIG